MLSAGVLANQIYSPSYVSADFALSYYGMIPETPALVTSMTMGRSRRFTTEFGIFSYQYCRSRAYPVGVTAVGEGQNRFLVATPEKALFDKLVSDRRFNGSDPESYLLDDLRLDEDSLRRLNRKRLGELAPFMTGRLKSVYDYLESLQ
jgi:predicted transcriptional regulator of viral defense system